MNSALSRQPTLSSLVVPFGFPFLKSLHIFRRRSTLRPNPSTSNLTITNPLVFLLDHVKGIHGTSYTGACSLLLSGAASLYADRDTDHGTTLWYSTSDPNGANQSTSTAFLSADTLTLRRSLGTSRPSRVLRRAGPHEGRHSPLVGVCYDEFYRVVEERVGQGRDRNVRSGTSVKFQLLRRRGRRQLEEVVEEVPTRRQRVM
ncbi:hypothetical protein VTI74DRAFT_2019 [Chaetomium olivicolor]